MKKLLLLIFAAIGTSHLSAQKTMICLTYDDALPSHLSTVIPQLDSFEFKGTFFLNAFQGSSTRIGEASPVLLGWKSAARAGHELANHTLFHPCPEKLGWHKSLAVESYTKEKLMKEIRLQHELLSLIDPSRTKRSYAYPCNNTMVAGSDYSNDLFRSGLISYCRGGGDSSSFVTDLKTIDRRWVPSWLVHQGSSLQQLIGFAQKACAAGGMAVYQFHGIGAEFFTVSADTHREFLSYLKENDSVFEVVTFTAGMNRVSIR